MVYEKLKNLTKRVYKTLEKLSEEKYPESWKTTTVTKISSKTLSPKDYYGRRILELADGRLVYNLAEMMYREDVSYGGQMSHTALWHLRSKQNLVKKIDKLAEQGYLKLSQK